MHECVPVVMAELPLRAPPLPRGSIRVLSPRVRRSTFVAVVVLFVVVVISMAHHAHGSGI